jgi:hydroxymethylpyrimidine/phosphomethylpyrimidine kinase
MILEKGKQGRVLVIAGSDSGGGAGIQADIKTIMACGGYAMTAITALTAQNTLGVHGVHPAPPAFVAQQMQVVLDDMGADAIKIGMLQDAPNNCGSCRKPQRLPGLAQSGGPGDGGDKW